MNSVRQTYLYFYFKKQEMERMFLNFERKDSTKGFDPMLKCKS